MIITTKMMITSLTELCTAADKPLMSFTHSSDCSGNPICHAVYAHLLCDHCFFFSSSSSFLFLSSLILSFFLFSSQNAPWRSETELCTAVKRVNIACFTRPSVSHVLCVGGLFIGLFSSGCFHFEFQGLGGSGRGLG